VRTGAWCWQDGGRRLQVTGWLDAYGAALLVQDAKGREPPREVVASGLALTRQGAATVGGALPALTPSMSRRRAVHDIRNSLAVLRLRLQMLPEARGLPHPAAGPALLTLDELTSAVDRLTSPPR
jgi:hypothetical protein